MEVKVGGKKGGIALVSPEDYDLVSKYKWSYDRGYATAKINEKKISMHRFVMNAQEGDKVDHQFRNKLDNRREVLNFTTDQKNAENRTKKQGASSKYFGVSYNKKDKKYRASFVVNKQRHSLGCYVNEIDAAEAIDMFIIHKNLDHKSLNFPEKRDYYLSLPYIDKTPIRTSKYIGVIKCKNKFKTQVALNKKRIFTFYSENEIECANKYDEYVVNNNLLNRKLNFPENYPDYNNIKVVKTFCEKVDNKTVRLLIEPKNKILIMDLEDYDKIKYYCCYLIKDGYIQFKINRENWLLHRYVMGVTDSDIKIDHIHGSENNCKSNLRLSNPQKNAQNKSKMKGTTSIYNGVSFDKQKGVWKTSLNNNYKCLFVCTFETEELAARYRDLFILNNLQDSYYKLNFEWNEKDVEYWDLKFKSILDNKFTSKYKGVYFDQSKNRWVVGVIKNGKTVYSEYFIDEYFAARQRDLYILTNLKKSDYKLNFDWTEKDINYWKNQNKYEGTNKTSKYMHIYFCKTNNKWRVCIVKD